MGSPELKFLQAALHGCDGVYGARFSGAGTRGACVALVQAGAPERVASQVRIHLRYHNSFGLRLAFGASVRRKRWAPQLLNRAST